MAIYVVSRVYARLADEQFTGEADIKEGFVVFMAGHILVYLIEGGQDLDIHF